MTERTLTDEQMADANRLEKLFLKRQNEAKEKGKKISQESIAFLCGWKTQANFNSYMKGRKPIGLEAAMIMAKALNATVEDISPSLANQITHAPITQSQDSRIQKPTIDQLRQQIADMQNPTHEGITFQDAELVSMSDNSDKVPVISWVAAGSWSNIEEVCLDDVAIKWLSRPARLSKRGFALTVKGRSMLPEFKPEDIIFVEPETGFLMLKDGDLVVVSCNNDTEATFKQLVIGETSDDMYLKPLNPEWHEQRMMPIGECNLVGKVIGKYVEY